MSRYASTIALFLLWTPVVWCASLDVYKWVDDDGSIHYEDRERVPYADKMTIKQHAPPTAPAAETNTGQDQRPGAASSVCKQARSLLNSYRNAPFLYEEVEGKRKILSDEERKRIESNAEKDVDAACGSEQ